MRTALLALPSDPGQADTNIEGLDRALQELDGCELAVVAEAFGQGFASITDDPEHDLCVGWRLDGPELGQVRDMARFHGTAICFGFIERDRDALHSSAIVATVPVRPSRSIDASRPVGARQRRTDPSMWTVPSPCALSSPAVA